MKKSKRVIALLLAVVFMAAALCGCGGGKPDQTPETTADSTEKNGSAQEPAAGGELTVGIAQDIDDSLDPQNMTAAGTREILFNIYEGLLKPDADGNLIPAVAESYAVSESGDTFTFKLREGVKFHNGEPVTGGDVVYSISRASGLESGEAAVPSMTGITSVEETEEGTIVIKTAEPDLEVLSYLTTAIIPEGSGVTTEMIGTGPFKMVSRVPQQEIVMERFDDYWGEPAYVDKVTFKVIEDADALVTALKSGAVDLCAHLTSSQAAGLESEFTVLEGTMNLVQALYLNNAEKPFDNEKVRQAMCYAVNPQEIMDFVADGRGTRVGSSMYPAFSKYFLPELNEAYPYDPAKAQALLAEAGYPDGFDMTITVPSNYQPHVDTAQVLVEQLKAVGIRATIQLVEWATWLSDVYQGREYQSTVVGLDAATLTAQAMLERFRSDGAKNFINFSDAEYDAELDKALHSTTEEEQTEHYLRLERILSERAANVYIQDLCDMVVMRPELQGYTFYPIYVMDLAKVYFAA